MDGFDYSAPAELFYPLKMGKRAPLSFHRFDTSAAAIKYAVEVLTPTMFHGAVIEIAEGERIDSASIRDLYQRAEFPLGRSQPA